jgi:hypothetical protein
VLATLDTQWKDQIGMWVPIWEKKPNAASPKLIHKILKETNLDDFDLEIEEVELYLLCFQKAFKAGEIYEALCEIERTLHAKIRMILIDTFGPQPETGWWRKGVPLSVRLDCVKRLEEDDECLNSIPYNYTTLINLKRIIEDNAGLFENRMPSNAAAKREKADIKLILRKLTKLNKIRDRMMHPVGATPPNEDDFFFVNGIKDEFDVAKWR